jgi:hypothetical protein
MKYFLHDTNALDDEKITELFMNFGYEGIGLFYCILEKIAKQEKPVKTAVLKKQLSVGKKLDKCWVFMEEIGLICSSNGETFNKQLLNFSEKYKIKKENNAKKISEWREKQQVTKDVTGYETVRNSPKVKVYKGIVSNNVLSNSNVGIASQPLIIEKDRCQKFIDYFNSVKNSKYQATDKVKKAFKLAIKNYTSEDLIKVLKNALADKYHIENGLIYITPEFILRPEIIERYKNVTEKIENQNRIKL